jgi:hypothetical protein
MLSDTPIDIALIVPSIRKWSLTVIFEFGVSTLTVPFLRK